MKWDTQSLVRMGKASIQAAHWAASLDAVISCWITSMFSVFATASEAPSGAFECLLQRQDPRQTYWLHLFHSPPAVSRSFLGCRFCCCSVCWLGDVPQLIWGGTHFSSLAQGVALVPDSEMWGRQKAQQLVFSFHLRKKTALQFLPPLPAVSRWNTVFLPCCWNFCVTSSLPL